MKRGSALSATSTLSYAHRMRYVVGLLVIVGLAGCGGPPKDVPHIYATPFGGYVYCIDGHWRGENCVK